uniref:Macaca fascicularis brain cDNA, clone: QflA-22935 n=1 Tax=Macaca fascicularis TaxID=9541 RepID=I7GDL7_MACFA|nr:unnamed protein product [Macaca fascicularis]
MSGYRITENGGPVRTGRVREGSIEEVKHNSGKNKVVRRLCQENKRESPQLFFL